MKKRVFIASSVEGLDVAYSLQENLDYDFEVTTWPQGVFELSKITIETLIKKAKESDAAVFIFTPDDDVIVRGEAKGKVRDNVVFELGLFIGILGLGNCFVVKPRSFFEFNLPTDLLGLSLADYEDKRTDKNLVAALGPAAHKIRRVLGPNITPRTRQTNDLFEILTSNPLTLFFNPQFKQSKHIVFSEDGFITEGNNKNEHKWRIAGDKLEILQLDGNVHSRFSYDSERDIFECTDDADVSCIRGQYILLNSSHSSVAMNHF